MRHLTLGEVLELHQRLIAAYGGSAGIRDLGALESALAQPWMSFGGEEFYPTVPEKPAALAFSLIKNHPFVDGNKRTGHAAMEVFLMLNGFEVVGSVDEQRMSVLRVASGEIDREAFAEWLRSHAVQRETD